MGGRLSRKNPKFFQKISKILTAHTIEDIFHVPGGAVDGPAELALVGFHTNPHHRAGGHAHDESGAKSVTAHEKASFP